MSATSLISFDASANAVTTVNEKMKTTTVRLLTAKEFKQARGLKGNAASVAYNAYLRECGQASTAGLAAALTSGELLVRSYRDSKNSVTTTFIKKSMLKDPATKAEAPKQDPAMVARLAALEALALKLGVSQEELKAIA